MSEGDGVRREGLSVGNTIGVENGPFDGFMVGVDSAGALRK